jgi:acyl carrier protein
LSLRVSALVESPLDALKEIEEFVFAEIAVERTVARDEDLIESDLLDSAGIVTLLAFLEEQFRIVIDDGVDLVPSNFRTIDAIASFVERKRASVDS